MLNLKELEESLDKALASETPESIAAWLVKRGRNQGSDKSSERTTKRIRTSGHKPFQAG